MLISSLEYDEIQRFQWSEKSITLNWKRLVIAEVAMFSFFHMMTSSNGKIFRVTGFCAGHSSVTDEFPAQRPVTRSFDVFFDLRLTNSLANNGDAGDFRRHRAHYDVIVMQVPRPHRHFWWAPMMQNLILDPINAGVEILYRAYL